MRLFKVVWLSLLAACSASDPESAPVDPAGLCVDSACGVKQVLLHIPNAENLLFSAQGRLFVSGGENVYEIVAGADGLQAEPLLDGQCNFTGLALRAGTLYAACFDGRLFAAPVGAGRPVLQQIHDLALASANGMALGPDDALYIVNGPLSPSAPPDPKIVRVQLESANPLAVAQQSVWLDSGLSFPNGITRVGETFFVTDGEALPPAPGVVKRIDIGPGGAAQQPQAIATFDSVLDDLDAVGGHLLVTLFSTGRIALLAPDGSVLAMTDPQSFDFPSAVTVTRPPLFDGGDLLVTEKGLLTESESSFGNALTLFSRSP